MVVAGAFLPLVAPGGTPGPGKASVVAPGSEVSPPFPLAATNAARILRELVPPPGQWRPYPMAGDRAAWQALPVAARTLRLQAAEKLLGCRWPQLTATEFLKFTRTGERVDGPHYERRQMLATLVLGEAIEGQGRLLDDILNGVWAICEETTWCIPAALVRSQREQSGLADITEPVVDLNAAETAGLLAWTTYLLRAELDRISPLVCARIVLEVDRRVLTPARQREDFHWMGFQAKKLNNWTPWICSNWMVAALLLETDEERRAQSLAKAVLCLQRYIQQQPPDGACEEGSHYWGVAAACLYDCLWVLESASAGRVNWIKLPVVKPMGEFMPNSHIAGGYFVNMGDCTVTPKAEAALIFRYGKSVDSAPMRALAASILARTGLEQELFQGVWRTNLTRYLGALFVADELAKYPAGEPLLGDVWLPSIELMAARDRAGTSAGLYVAAWAGNNGRSHGHNDTGNFILFAEGQPILIDVGADSYSAKTFSRQRFEIWNNQSAYHNLPTINGQLQGPNEYLGYEAGRKYTARAVSYTTDEQQASLSMDLAAAYPAEARVVKWYRTVSLKRGQGAVVCDAYELAAVDSPPVWNFMTAAPPHLAERGIIRLRSPAGKNRRPISVTMSFDASDLEVVPEEITVPAGPLRVWGEKLWRIQLRSRATGCEGEVAFSFRITEASD
jgi:hypothetical protein